MSPSPACDPAVIVEGLSYRFVAREHPSLVDVSFSLAPGTWTLVAGLTGSGKSTLLCALAGLIPHHAAGDMAGTVRLFGRDTRDVEPSELAATAGLVLQTPDDQICTSSVGSEVAFGLANLCLPPAEIERRSALWLNKMGLADRIDQSTSTLSGGQKQRLLLASIPAMGSRLLLLDEPLSQLDVPAAAELLDLLQGLRDEGFSIVVAEHRLDELIERVDRVLVLDDGRVRADCSTGGRGAHVALAAAGLTVEPPASEARLDTKCRVPSRTRRRWCGRPDLATGLVSRSHPCGRMSTLRSRRASAWGSSVRTARARARCCTCWRVFSSRRREASRPPLEPGEAPLALVPQNPDLTLICPTVFDELCFGPLQWGHSPNVARHRAHEAADTLGIDALMPEPPLALSQGQRLRVAVAAALALRPRLLLLDEPTTGQDPREAQRLLAAIVQAVAVGETGAVLFSTHDVRIVARFASRALVLAEGRLIADGPAADLLADTALMRRARLMRAPRRPVAADDSGHGLPSARDLAPRNCR